MPRLTNCVESGRQRTPITSFVQRAKEIAAAAFYNMFLACRCEHLLMNQTEAAKDVKFRPTSSVSFRRSLVTPRGLQRLTLSTITVPTHSGHSHFSRHCSSESVWLEPRAGRGLRLPKLSSLDFKHLKLREHKTAFGLQLSKH